jgi:hypothetical protein
MTKSRPYAMTRVSSIDLQVGVVHLMDGQIIPITRYIGPPDEAPDEGEPVSDFDWVRSVVAGPTADGDWLAVETREDDKP